MLTFLDGPAEGEVLACHRAPAYLRVVQSLGGKWDALDQLEDEPAPRETIHVYARQGADPPPIVHLNMGSIREGSGFYPLADYRHRADVDGESVRDTEAWREWCRAQPLPGQEALDL